MPEQPTDPELVERLSTGDEDAFCLLYARYWERLRNFCYRFVRSQDLAENYAQDIFLKIWENKELLDPGKSFSSYLYTIARNKAINYLRQVARSESLTRKLIKSYTDRTATESEGGEELLEKDYLLLLQNAIHSLPPRQQEVFRLSRNCNLSHKEIAERLGLSVYTVQEYISCSIKSIKLYVSKYSGIVFSLLFIISNTTKP